MTPHARPGRHSPGRSGPRHRTAARRLEGAARAPGPRRLATALVALALLPLDAAADHVAPPVTTGLGWTTWLLIAGAVAAVALAAWAFFAPDRPEPPRDASAPPRERR